MTKEQRPEPSRFKMKPVEFGRDANDVAASMRQAIQKRAYERFQARHSQDGDDLADWFAAEQDLLLGKAPSVSELANNIDVQMDLGDLEPETLRLAIEPRHVLLVGAYRQWFGCGNGSDSFCEERPYNRFRSIELPAEVNPDHVAASMVASNLTVMLRKIGSEDHRIAACPH